MNQHYALLVGIGKYAVTENMPSRLKAPPNDVEEVEKYLRQSPLNIIPKKLIGKAATREAIINTFKEHLIDNAAEGALLLFYFSGHGSTENAHDDILQYQGSKVNETLVCYDSREEGKHDLADKELKYLIKQAVDKKAEMVVIVDACHSGSITRTLGAGRIKEAPASETIRPVDTYLEGSLDVASMPRHLLIAACQKDQTAQEFQYRIDGDILYKSCFTTNLLSILECQKQLFSYRRLIDKCVLKVHSEFPFQTPRMRVYGFFDTYKPFLKLESPESQSIRWNVTSTKGKDEEAIQWRVNFGLINGMPFTPDDPAKFAIYEDDDLKSFICFAEVEAVALDHSSLKVEADKQELLKEGEIYVCVPIYLPTQKLSVYTNMLPTEMETYFQVLESYQQFMLDHLIEWEHENKEITNYTLSVKDGAFVLRDTETQQLIYPKYEAKQLTNKEDLAAFTEVIQYLGNWQRYTRISQPVQFSKYHHLEYFPMEFTAVDSAGNAHRFEQLKNRETTEATLDYPGEWGKASGWMSNVIGWSSGEEESKIDYHITTYNNNPQQEPLYIHFIHCTKDALIESLYDQDTVSESRFELTRGDDQQFSLEESQNQDTHFFKLFVSDTPFKHFFPDQQSLSQLEEAQQQKEEEVVVKGLMRSEDEEEKKAVNVVLTNWFTQTLKVKVLRELGDIGSISLDIPRSILTICAHTQFVAKASLASTAINIHSHESDYYLRNIAKKYNFGLVDFSTSGEKLSILEMHHIKDKTAVGEDNPLKIHIRNNITAELLIPVTLPEDMELNPHLLPVLGEVKKLEVGKKEWRINAIPNNPHDGRLVSGQSLKLSLFIIPETDIQQKETWIVLKDGELFLNIEQIRG